jgi:ATP-dependent DNA helicase 2 subunit 2
MGDVYYVWADPGTAQSQIALSSVVQAMYEKNVMAIARWVSKDDGDPKMGVLSPCVFEKVDCFLFTQVGNGAQPTVRAALISMFSLQMPFADDIRKYTCECCGE